MTDNKDKALVNRQDGEITGLTQRTSPVIGRMTEDVLTKATASAMSQARYRIGEYELREPDYLQICDWAQVMDISPEELLSEIYPAPPFWVDHYEEIPEEFHDQLEPYERGAPDDSRILIDVEDGAIVRLRWNLKTVPYIPQTWRDGLLIESLAFEGDWPDLSTVLRPCLPRLKSLYLCADDVGFHESFDEACRIHIGNLDLSYVTRLTWFTCEGSNLAELDLSSVPRLTTLLCENNLLNELDLSPVPRLTELRCGGNQLTELDLSPVPGLTELWCDENVTLLNSPADLKVSWF